MTGERILIVDDDPDMVDFCRRVLQEEGYQVRAVLTRREAIEVAHQGDFQLVLMDIDMPGLDGLETVRTMKQQDPSVVGVLMTGHGSIDIALRALRSGMEDLIIKPFSPEQLSETVASALEKERIQQENVRLRALIPLYELSESFVAATNLQDLLDQIVQVSCRETGANRVSLMLLSEDGDTLTIQAAIGLPREVVENTAVRLGEGIAGRVAQLGEPLILDRRTPPGKELRKLMTQEQISSAICIPLKVKNELLGVLNLSRLGQDASPFTKGSVELASVLAGQAAIAIKNARLFEEIQQAYRDLKKLDELKSEFISVAAHELRTPLAVLLGYATLLEEQVSDESRKYTQAIIHSALQLKKLVADMLNLRYLETGEMELELEELHPLEIVRAVVGELGFLAEEKGQQLVVEVPGDLPMVRADRQKLQLVLSNLVSNAIKFTHDGGAIRIEASMSNDLLTVAVKDPGIGIGNEEHERIFDRFYQVEDSLTRQHDGLGLGLSIARGLVELHQGHLWVESSEGQGSTFYFTVSRRL